MVLPILKERLKTSAVYVRAALDCLEQHRRTMNHTLEGVQAIIVLQFLINHIEPLSPRYRALFAEAVMASHCLGLHRLDSAADGAGQSQDGMDPIAQEMKRRVWWYLTATDWMVSMVEGMIKCSDSRVRQAANYLYTKDLLMRCISSILIRFVLVNPEISTTMIWAIPTSKSGHCRSRLACHITYTVFKSLK